jgi:hypothetical protein
MIAGAKTKVVLIDGTVTDTWSNEWREECMARDKHVQAVCRMLGKQYRGRRDAYCTSVGIMEGAEAEKRLRARIKEVWPKGID